MASGLLCVCVYNYKTEAKTTKDFYVTTTVSILFNFFLSLSSCILASPNELFPGTMGVKKRCGEMREGRGKLFVDVSTKNIIYMG